MDKKKLWKFIIFVPFALAIGAFTLYLRYYFELKSKAGTKVTDIIEVSLVRYRNIGIFCLAVGVILLFIKTLIDYFKVEDNNVTETKKVSVLDRISSRKEVTDTKYTFSENKIISDLLKGKVLKGVFINENKTIKNIQFKNYDSDKATIEFYDLDPVKEEKTVVAPVVMPVQVKETIAEPVKKDVVVIKNEPEFDSKLFKKCKKCNKVIAKDSIMCVHCGTVIKEKEVVEEKKESRFNPVIFAVNMIVILLCIILTLLVINKINHKVDTNKENLNISYVSNLEQ
ncbi:MAG: hypothetical protein IJH20_03860 [Bacilli bacterium]|nr:hypothetical protein [Bacilli bacterium]